MLQIGKLKEENTETKGDISKVAALFKKQELSKPTTPAPNKVIDPSIISQQSARDTDRFRRIN